MTRFVGVGLLGMGVACLLSVCGGSTAKPLPTYPVTVKMGALVPDKVGSYDLSLDTGLFIFSDWAAYGSTLADTPSSSSQSLTGGIIAHAGHQHGAAELTAKVDGEFLLDLTGPAQVLGVLDMTEGHYFDGRIRLVHGDEDAQVLGQQDAHLDSSSPVFGHTLYLEGTATDDQGDIHFVIVVDVEATVPGLAYARTVKEGGEMELVTRLDLGAVLGTVDFRSLAQDGEVLIDPDHNQDTYLAVKAALSDPASYVQDDLEPPN